MPILQVKGKEVIFPAGCSIKDQFYVAINTESNGQFELKWKSKPVHPVSSFQISLWKTSLLSPKQVGNTIIEVSEDKTKKINEYIELKGSKSNSPPKVLISIKWVPTKKEQDENRRKRHKELLSTPRSRPTQTLDEGETLSEETKVVDAKDVGMEYVESTQLADYTYKYMSSIYAVNEEVGTAEKVEVKQTKLEKDKTEDIVEKPVDSKEVEEPEKGANLADFNERFQKTSQQILLFDIENSPMRVRMSTQQELIKLVQDFLFAARNYGRIIISEQFLPNEQKTLKPTKIGGMVGGDKFIVQNILFKFAVDSHGFFQSDSAAAKVAGHELKGLVGYYNCGILGLHVPLECLIDYRGFRLIAITLLPVDNSTLKVGSADAAQTIHLEDKDLLAKLKTAARMLNIKPHKCKGKVVYSPVDLEGHRGHDGRQYLLDFSRVFPPEAPNPKFKNSHLFRLFRPEFVRLYPKPLCSDGFSGFIKFDNPVEHNNELKEATEYLYNVVIPNFAEELETSIREHKEEPKHFFRITRMMHERGINARYLGKVFMCMQSDAKELLLIEMSSRIIKSEMRRLLREKMKSLKFPLEQPYRDLVIEYLNGIFSNAPRLIENYWNGTIKRGIGQYFDLQEEHLLNLHQRVMNNGGAGKLFSRLVQMTGLNFKNRIHSKLESNRTFTKLFHESDLIDLGDRVKHMNIVAQAQAFVLKEEAFATQEGFEEKMSLYELSAEKYEESLDTDPTNRVSLLGLANLKLNLIQEQQEQTMTGGAIFLDVTKPEVKELKKLLKKCLKYYADNTHVIQQYAEFLEYCRLRTKSLEYYLRSVERDPSHTVAAFRYAQKLKDLNHPDAKEFFQWIDSK